MIKKSNSSKEIDLSAVGNPQPLTGRDLYSLIDDRVGDVVHGRRTLAECRIAMIVGATIFQFFAFDIHKPDTQAIGDSLIATGRASVEPEVWKAAELTFSTTSEEMIGPDSLAFTD